MIAVVMEWESWETIEALARLEAVVRSHTDGIKRTFFVTQVELAEPPPPRRTDSTTEPMPFSRSSRRA